MIFEMRTYLLKPGTPLQAEQAFGERIEARSKLSRIAGFWRTEVGALNQRIHIWAYKNMGERETLRAKAMNPGQWPPPRHESVTLHRQQSTFAIPAKWSPL